MSFASHERRSLVARIAGISYRHPGHPALTELRRERDEMRSLEINAWAFGYLLKEELITRRMADYDVEIRIQWSTRFATPDGDLIRERIDRVDVLPCAPPRPVCARHAEHTSLADLADEAVLLAAAALARKHDHDH